MKDLAEMFLSASTTRPTEDAAALAVAGEPGLSNAITDAIGEGWVTDLTELGN
jgi:hypothetical protein